MLAVISLSFIQCENKEEELTNSQEIKTLELKSIAKQLYGVKDLNVEVLNSSVTYADLNFFPKSMKDKLNGLKKSDLSNFEGNNLKVQTNTKEGIVNINSYLIEKNGSEQLFFIKFENDNNYESYYSMRLEEFSDGKYRILDVLEEGSNSKLNRSWLSDYGDCIGKVISTDNYSGKVITVLGIAGGAGCVPCGITGAVIFGFGALGCAGV